MILYKILLLFLFCFVQGKVLPRAGDIPFELNEFLYGTYSARSFNGTWLTEDSILFRNGSDTVLFNVKTRTSEVFLPSSALVDYPGGSITVSADQQFVLIRYSVHAVFRHSTTALYAIYDLDKNEYYDIAGKNQTQYVQWAPQGHGLVYVYLNNIYYLPEPSAEPVAVTSNGVPGVVYNGVPDWVYEEEVLGTGSALWFSPNGKQLVFATFNDTEVDEFKYFIYNPENVDLTTEDSPQYPTEVDIRYPKVGRKNPTVVTYVANLETAETTLLKDVTAESWRESEDYILYDIVWITDEQFSVLYSNRIQNQAHLLRCSSNGGCASEPESTYQEDNGWLEPHLPKYSKSGAQKIEILPLPEGDDKYDHLLFTDVETKEQKRLTQGPFYVLAINGWDEANDLIYYTASVANEPSQRQVYVLNLVNNSNQCLTCNIQTSWGLCKYAAASFSKDFSYVTTVCQGPGPYVVHVKSTQDDSDVLVWEDNAALVARLENKAIPIVKNLKVPVANGFVANVRLLLPPGLDENSDKKYPAVVNVYAGPNSNQISDAYSSGFQNYIVTNREYIYIYIDGRGSGKDGQNKMFQIYKNMATVEIEDQIAENLNYIDADRTGIWGWSYGGFATAWVLVQDVENVFRFGLSVAPVTNFILYDSIYTERYMGLPVDSAAYNRTDLMRRVEAFRGKNFLLIHGNADDNVHYQQSMLLSQALERADILFRQQSYPDENHSLGYVSAHLYHTIDRFWAQSFGLPDPPAPRFVPKKQDVESE